jgi:3-phosphoshikimate 1-carboxyvinyltransferase
MSSIKVTAPKSSSLRAEITLSGSKSISNRILMIQALSGKAMKVKNLSNAEDTKTMYRLLLNERDSILDAGPAGTTFRFLTAYLATRPGKSFLTGSNRMLERPISILVDALNSIGANIKYAGKKGFPPLTIDAPNFSKTQRPELNILSEVSSQYITALLLIAPKLDMGLTINLVGSTVSEPYIDMTLALMREYGIDCQKQANKISVVPGNYLSVDYEVESDWSSASYFYAIAALATGDVQIKLKTLNVNSIQGDASIAKIMKVFGVETVFQDNGEILLTKIQQELPASFEYDFTDCPDLAPTVAICCAGLGIPSKLTGLKTLVIKESDRISALKNELEKLSAEIKTTSDSLEIIKGISKENLNSNILINTYKDHRMAMSFAPLALVIGNIKFDNREVVNKSYPNFWTDLEKLGFAVK